MGNKHPQTTQINTINSSGLHEQPNRSQKAKSIYSQLSEIQISWYRHKYPYELANMFSLFTRQPLQYVNKISVIKQTKQCCDTNTVKLQTFMYKKITLDNLICIKRMKRDKFAEAQIWYIIGELSGIFMLLQAHNLPYGSISAKRLFLKDGKFIKIGVNHFRLDHEHCNQISLSNYYSPQFISCLKSDLTFKSGNNNKKPYQRIDIFKSQVFSFGLLLLQMLTCPEPHPKFIKFNFEQFLWHQVYSKLQMASKYYSPTIISLISLMLRQDCKIRPNWSYLRIWVKTQKQARRISVAPCVYWSI